MKKKIFHLILLFNLYNVCYSQSIIWNNKIESEEFIVWTTQRKLNWEDFKSKEKTQNIGVAQTGVNIEIKPYLNKRKKYDYKVLGVFYKNKSWTQTENLDVLRHEQIHFDIAELYARKMRKEIALVKSKNNIVKELDYRKIHKLLFTEYLSFQGRYDSETEYSKNSEIQEKWNNKIVSELNKLKNYKLNI